MTTVPTTMPTTSRAELRGRCAGHLDPAQRVGVAVGGLGHRVEHVADLAAAGAAREAQGGDDHVAAAGVELVGQLVEHVVIGHVGQAGRRRLDVGADQLRGDRRGGAQHGLDLHRGPEPVAQDLRPQGDRLGSLRGVVPGPARAAMTACQAPAAPATASDGPAGQRQRQQPADQRGQRPDRPAPGRGHVSPERRSARFVDRAGHQPPAERKQPGHDQCAARAPRRPSCVAAHWSARCSAGVIAVRPAARRADPPGSGTRGSGPQSRRGRARTTRR